MVLRLSQHTAPTAEPVHLTEAKLHLKLAVNAAGAVLYTHEDDLLASLISAARQVAETETWRAIVLQEWDLFLDEWPIIDEIGIPMPPLMSVESIVYTESDGTESTFAATEYGVDTDSTPGRIVLGYEKVWPTETLTPKNPIRVRFRCGYVVPFAAADDTDILTAVNHPYADGDKVRLSVSGGALPAGSATLTDYFVRDVSGNTLKLAASAGGDAIDITDTGTGNMFIGEIPPATVAGMKLVITDFHEQRGDIVTGRSTNASLAVIPRAASHLFGLDAAKEF